jgi:hypothetical protein
LFSLSWDTWGSTGSRWRRRRPAPPRCRGLVNSRYGYAARAHHLDLIRQRPSKGGASDPDRVVEDDGRLDRAADVGVIHRGNVAIRSLNVDGRRIVRPGRRLLSAYSAQVVLDKMLRRAAELPPMSSLPAAPRPLGREFREETPSAVTRADARSGFSSFGLSRESGKSSHSCRRTYASTGLARSASKRCAPLFSGDGVSARCRLDVPVDRFPPQDPGTECGRADAIARGDRRPQSLIRRLQSFAQPLILRVISRC